MSGSSRGGSAWNVDHPVLQLLHARRASGSVPGARTDGARLAVAVEGGGMRGAISASMITALDELGFRDSIDVVHGISSGAVNAAYFAAGSTWFPLSIYYDDLTTSRFLDFRRALSARSVLDLEYAYETVVRRTKPLDLAGALASPIELAIAVTDVDNLKTLVVKDFAEPEELLATLKASAWLPFAVRGTGHLAGRRVLDGGVLVAHPVELALADGATHILSFSTKPAGVRRGPTATSRVVSRRLDGIRPGLGAGYRAALADLEMRTRWMEAERRDPSTSPPHVLDVAPLEGRPEVKRHELRRGVLLDACRDAFVQAFAVLERRPEAEVRSGRLTAVPRFVVAERTSSDHLHLHLPTADGGPLEPLSWPLTNRRLRSRRTRDEE